MISCYLSNLRRLSAPLLQASSAIFQTKHTYAKYPGNPQIKPYKSIIPKEPRWKIHWLRAVKRKMEIEGEEPRCARRDKGCWDEEAEVNCFKARLGITVDNNILASVFTSDSSSTLDSPSSIQEHQKLSNEGEDFCRRFIHHYISISLHSAPEECQKSVYDYLLEEANVANIASHLGFDDLVKSPVYPLTDDLLVSSFYASLAAISQADGPVVAGRLLLDFVVPQLVGKDILHDIWKPKDPMKLLIKELCKRSQEPPEARLVHDVGINTVMPCFVVALFSDKEFLAESGAESIILAEIDAAKIALRKMYKIEETGKSLLMGVRVDEEFLYELFTPFVSRESLKISLQK